MNENIHRETFREILNLQRSQRSRVERTSFPVTFKNFGKAFADSFMWESTLPPDAQERQDYAESVAQKYGCKVSYRAVYSATGKIDNLLKVREALIGRMYVSPVMWAPLSKDRFSHFKTFAFGFFPYCDRRPFVYDSTIDIRSPKNSNRSDYEITETDLSTESLHRMISRRIRLLNDGATPDIIWLNKDKDLHYCMLSDKANVCLMADDSMYPADMSTEEYFDAVIKDNNAESFVMPEYRMLFARAEQTAQWEGDADDGTKARICHVRNLLSKRLAVSYVSPLIFDSRYCYAFGYDSKRFDDVTQHFGFFDTYFHF